MLGDKYQVFKSYGPVPGTEMIGEFDGWHAAKEFRNETFFADTMLRACWIMRVNPSMNLRPERYGNSLKRTKHEVY